MRPSARRRLVLLYPRRMRLASRVAVGSAPPPRLATFFAAATVLAAAAALLSSPAAAAGASSPSASFAPGVTASAVTSIPDGWTNLGAPLPGVVYAMVRYRGTIYAGGQFDPGLARWDEQSGAWTMLGTDEGRVVRSLAVGPDGTLYAGGDKEVRGVQVAFVATWDGSTWQDLGVASPGVAPGSSSVWSIAVDTSGRLYAGGMFQEIAGVQVNQLAAYDGKGWSALPGPLSAIMPVPALTIGPDGTLYAGGFFLMNGAYSYAAKLKNGAWSFMQGLDYACPGLNPCMGIMDMEVDSKGTVQAMGQLKIGSTLTGYATWSGTSWTAQPTGGMTAGTAIAIGEDDAVYGCLGDKVGGSQWLVARLGDPVTSLGTPTGNDGIYALVVHEGTAYAAFSTTDPGDPTAPWQVASFALPTKTKASALPRNIRFIDANNGKPTLAWKAPAYLNPGSYRVQYRLAGATEWLRARVLEGLRQAVLPRSYAGDEVDVRVRARGGNWRTVTLVASTSTETSRS